jgi:hypothetical protein
MTAIAPVLFDAFPEDATHDRETPYRTCFNAGAPSEAVQVLWTRYEEPRAALAAGATVVLGVLALVCTVIQAAGTYVIVGSDALNAQEWAVPVILSGIALAAAGGAWAWYLNSRFHPKAKAWRKSLGETWAAHGADITELWRLGYPMSSDVRDFAEKLEGIREALNRLSPEGDELDVARYRLQGFIDASNLPLLGKRAAEATHIKDPKVRQAAMEYKQALRQQEFARKALENEIEGVKDLLATRLQARSDAEIIRLVHER